MAEARFITFEGGEGAGKSTQVGLLAAALRAEGLAVAETREPGGSPGAEQIRNLLVDGPAERWLPLTEALLHSAARAEHLARTVRPALAAGTWVLCDRFTDSTLAYQGYGHKLGTAPVEALRGLVAERPRPDLTLVIDLPVELGLARAGARAGGAARYEAMGTAFHQRVREGFQAIARAEPERCALIDGRGDADAVHRAVCKAVTERLGLILP
ncbi:MAG: dTMP kinase [Kiloniellales bacterium]|nr:dTMP kinase [Kiloniellales bacterium]